MFLWLKLAACVPLEVMHCAWLPLLKHFTNSANVLSTLLVRCANGGGAGGQECLNLSRWHLFYFLPGHLEFT